MSDTKRDASCEIEALVAAFDDVRASDDLKSRTLSALFAQLDADEAAHDAEFAPEASRADDADAPRLVMWEGGSSHLDELHEQAVPAAEGFEGDALAKETAAEDSAAAPLPDVPAAAAVGVRRRRRGWWAKAAAVAVAFTLATSGVAYALPSSYVTVSSGDTNVELGVNVFGVAVSAESDTDTGKELLKSVSVRGKGYEDAMDVVLDALSVEGETDGIDVQVSGGFAGRRERMEKAAERVLDKHRAPAEDAESASGQAGTHDQAPANAPLQEVQPSGAQDAPQVQEGPTGAAEQGAVPSGEQPEPIAPEGNDETAPVEGHGEAQAGEPAQGPSGQSVAGAPAGERQPEATGGMSQQGMPQTGEPAPGGAGAGGVSPHE